MFIREVTRGHLTKTRPEGDFVRAEALQSLALVLVTLRRATAAHPENDLELVASPVVTATS
jgi:hypothetical protein